LNPELPRAVWILQAGGLANFFGNGIVIPFLIIYLHNVRGVSLGAAGAVAAVNSAGALVSGFAAGTLSDRVGPRRILMGALLVMAASISFFPLIRTAWHAFALSIALGLGSGAFWPSQSSLLTSLTGLSRRHAAFGLQRVSMNLGIALGGLTGGFIASTSHPHTFTVLFLLDALTFVAYVVVLSALRSPESEAHEHAREPGTYAGVVRDRVFMRVVLLNALFMAAAMSIMVELLPPFAKNHAHVTERGIGILWFIPSLVITLAQLPVTKLVEGRRRMRLLALMGLVWAAAELIVLVAGWRLEAAAATAVMGFAVALFALGECLHGAIHAPLAADLAQPGTLGRYMAFSSQSWQVGWIVGPGLGGVVLQYAPDALWLVGAAVCVANAAYALTLERRLPVRIRVTPLEGSAAGVAGTMENMVLATDEPLSTSAQPAPHSAATAPHACDGGRPATAHEAR
ncbi:MAG TPA: MFS transporter, partial [Gaiellaceae bacterium]|nr:MFS transporter [Gaiellaceae bacterium]